MATNTMTYTGELVIRACWCGIKHAIPKGLDDHIRRSKRNSAFCPLGHSYVVADSSNEERLAAAEAKVTHLADQLQAAERNTAAAVRDAEKMRAQLIKDRQRFANGVCPCCRRAFHSVIDHIRTEHPDYDPSELKAPVFECSCDRTFETLKGLHIHQGHARGPNWFKPTMSRWGAHLTVVE